jgi:hypothetical protein
MLLCCLGVLHAFCAAIRTNGLAASNSFFTSDLIKQICVIRSAVGQELQQHDIMYRYTR